MSKSVCEPDRKNLTKRPPDRTCEMCARNSACDDTINWQYFFLKAQYVLDSDDEGFRHKSQIAFLIVKTIAIYMIN